MNPAPVSPTTFHWIVTVLTVAASIWAMYDVVKLANIKGADRSDPKVRDQRFGYFVGMLIGLFALSGILRSHGVF